MFINRSCTKKVKRNCRIAYRTEQKGEIIVKKDKEQSAENNDNIAAHHFIYFIGDIQKMKYRICKGKYDNVHYHSDCCDKNERCGEAVFQLFAVAFAETHGKDRAAAHAKSDEHGGNERHKRVSRADCCERIGADKLSNDE